MSVVGRAVLAITERERIRTMVTEGRAGVALSRRFVAGETLDDAVAVAKTLNEEGASVSLDYLGEHITHPDEAEQPLAAYRDALARIAADGIDANISIKLTQLGLGLDRDLVLASLRSLAETAASAGTTISIDMEESALTEATIEVYEMVQAEVGNLGIALQAYLYRTGSDLVRLMPLGGHIRLCKGAYAESEEVAHQRAADVDSAFDDLMGTLMENSSAMPAIATHDADRIALARYLGTRRAGPWEFQMLYGVRRELQTDLLAAEYPLRVYVPYGDAWYPYLTRRLAERPHNLAFFLRAAVSR